MAAPRITIVTPSFNQGRFLDETLRSVIGQRGLVHEYFVIDGGSTDGSVDVIQRHADRIDYWVSEKDAGQADAIRKGFARATGDYLYWINSDDVLLPGALARVHALLTRRPEVDALTGYHMRMDAESRIISAHRIPTEGAGTARWGMLHVNQQSCFFRRSIYERVGGLDGALHCVMDTELWCRMFDAGTVWGHVPEYLAGFRQHGEAKGSASAWQERYRGEERMLREKYPQYCADTWKHWAGLKYYRAGQVLSGRQFKALADTRRWRGRMIEEVFGPYAADGVAGGR